MSEKYPRCESAGLDMFRYGGCGAKVIMAANVEAYLERQAKPTWACEKCGELAPSLKLSPKKEASVEFFKPEDFRELYEPEPYSAAETANRILAERGVRVYGPSSTSGPANWNEQPGKSDTHTALLIAVEPIVRESEERQLLRELSNIVRRCNNSEWMIPATLEDIVERARKLLGDK